MHDLLAVPVPCACRFASEFGLQPVVVSNSQTDWFSPEKFSLEELRRLIGSTPVRVQSKPCEAGTKAHDTNTCHSIKESDPELVGHRWASLKPTNLTEIGVDTYDEFLTKQVRNTAFSLPREHLWMNSAAY